MNPLMWLILAAFLIFGAGFMAAAILGAGKVSEARTALARAEMRLGNISNLIKEARDGGSKANFAVFQRGIFDAIEVHADAGLAEIDETQI